MSVPPPGGPASGGTTTLPASIGRLGPRASAALPARAGVHWRWQVLILFALHAVLGLVVYYVPPLATLHALGALAVGVGLALGRSSPAPAIYAVGYLSGSELLWRMNQAQIFWEYGKYSVCLVVLLLILRFRLRRGMAPLAMLYLFMLAPAAVTTLTLFGFSGRTREYLSMALSGPVTLALLVFFLSGIDSRWLRVEKLLLSMLAPMVSALAIVAFTTLTRSAITFGSYSNYSTSGGYGPNQTSAVLGLAALLALLLALHTSDRELRFAYLVLAGGSMIATILTFSRGGVFNIVVCLMIWGVHYLHRPALRRALLLASVFLLIAGAGLLPRINEWTQGSLSDRYSSIDTTGRAQLARADLHLFYANPVLGVGAGRSSDERKKLIMRRIASHTEYTRLLAEHGIFGVAALLILLAMIGIKYVQAPNAVTRGWVAGTAGWTFASMAHVSMRIALISLLFALATLSWPREGEG